MSKRSKGYLLICFAATVIFLSVNFIKTSIVEVYYFNIQPTSTIMGYVVDKQTIDDMAGARTFQYTITYTLGNTAYTYKEMLSPDSVTLPFDNSVLIKYSTQHPRIATIKNRGAHYGELGIASVLVIVSMIMCWHAYHLLRYNIDFDNDED